MSKKTAKATATAPAAETETAVAVAAPVAPAPAQVKGSLPLIDAALVPSAPAKGAARASGSKQANPMPQSTVDKPVAVAWALYAQLYAQHGVALTRKQATDAAMAAGVAFYTARTQYQLWRQAMLNAAKPAAAPAA